MKNSSVFVGASCYNAWSHVFNVSPYLCVVQVVQHDPTKHQKHRKEEAELAGVAAAGYGLKEHHDKKKLEEATGMEKKHHLF